MTTGIFVTRWLHLAFYFFIASQGAFYLLGFYNILAGIPSRDFILLRKAADPVIAPRLKILYLLTIAVSLTAFLLNYRVLPVLPLLLSITATLLLFIDVFIALKISEPLNRIITEMQEPFTAATPVHRKWLAQIRLRAFLSAGGFLLLLLAYLKKS